MNNESYHKEKTDMNYFISQIKSKIFNLFLQVVPVKRNKIIFNNFCGKGFGDNPKYIAEEILKRSQDYDLVWMLNDLNEYLPKGIRPVLNCSRKARYELATSRVIVCNVKHALVFKKKKKQFYIQTWHGSFGLKYIEKDAQDKLPSKYLNKSIADSKNIDLMLSSSNWQTEEYKRAFWYDGNILEEGFPRNDILFNISEERIKQIKSKINIPTGKKILLYAPTFRDGYSITAYNIDLNKVKEILEFKTKEQWVVLVRLHPNIKTYTDLLCGEDYIDVTSFSDGQQILAISDILITDYSSNMIDFILMNKPVFLYSSDIQEYKVERGLKPVYFELPFHLCQNNQELYTAINNFKMNHYLEGLYEFKKKYQSFDKGHASKCVVDIIFEKTKN